MVMTYAAVTGRITIPGTELGIRAKVTAVPMSTDHALAFADRVTWGPRTVETDAAGNMPTGGSALKIPQDSTLGDAVLWKITAEAIDRLPGLPRKWTVAVQPITDDISIQELVTIDLTMVSAELATTVGEYAAAAAASETAAEGWADAAADSAADSDASADQADISEANAATSASTASSAAGTATTKAGEASSSATAAAGSATAAAGSATAASTSASAAAGSATAAAGSATAAGASATNAATSATAANAAKVAAEAVGSTNDTIIAGRINDPASATASSLMTSFVRINATSAHNAAIGIPEYWDNFQRSDRNILGDQAPSGHVYERSGTDALTSTNQSTITDHTLRGAAGKTNSDINFIKLRTAPTLIRAKWRFRATPVGSTSGNTVFGTGAWGFNPSIQISLSRTRIWVEYHTVGATSPYPHVGTDMTFVAPLVDGVEYEVACFYDKVNSALTVMAPDGAGGYQFATYTDAVINDYWGNTLGIQDRSGSSSNGFADLLWIEAAVPDTPRQQPIYASSPRLDGGYVRCAAPPAFDPAQDLELIAYVAPDKWVPGGTPQQSLIAQWGGSGDHCFGFHLGPTGTPFLYGSIDGASTSGLAVSSSVAAPGTDGTGMWVRATRSVSSGDVKFYYSNDPVATAPGSVTWTQLGTTRSTTAGALHLSPAAITLGGREGNPPDWPLSGIYKVAQILSGGTPVAQFDARAKWNPLGVYGNVWKLVGETSWATDIDSVPALRATLNAASASINGVLSNPQTGTTYTLVAGDVGKAVTMTNSGANSVTIPPHSAVAFPVGTVINIEQWGTGTTSVAAVSGVTLRVRGGASSLAGQYACASIRQESADVWILAGDLA